MIFPGMDPYLENPVLFPGIHSRLIVYLADQISMQIQPRYVASVGDRVYVESGGGDRPIIPDVWVRFTNREVPEQLAGAGPDSAVVVDVPDLEVTQPFIEILDRESNLGVVTVIELVSPTNKYQGPGRDAYVAKQREVRCSTAHLVEIDLLRRGPHVVAMREDMVRGRYDYDYLVCINRAGQLRTRFELYPFTVRQPLPRIPIPLADDDPDAVLDIRAPLEQAWGAGGYAVRIDYRRACEPPLSPVDQEWADELIRDYFDKPSV
jgi:hypothetical protein